MRLRAVHTATLAIACLLIAGCGSATSRKSATRDSTAPTSEGARAPAARVAADFLSQGTDEPIVKIANVTVTGGMLHHWLTVGAETIGPPEPPRFTTCVTYLGLGRDNTATPAQLALLCKQKYEQVLRHALSLLIHAQWLIDEAAATGVKIDAAKLKRETDLSGPDREHVKEMLRDRGETISDLRLTLTLLQLSARFDRKLERDAPPLTHSQIAAFYRHHKGSFVVPEERNLYIVRLGRLGEANKAKRELEHGASFATIVSHSSLVQPTGAQDGLLYGLRPENWPEKPLAEAIFHAPLKTLGGPVHISWGYYLFEVVGKKPGRQRTLSEAKAEAAAQLRRLQHERITARFVAAFTKKWSAHTVCARSHVASFCRELRSAPAGPLEVPNLLF